MRVFADGPSGQVFSQLGPHGGFILSLEVHYKARHGGFSVSLSTGHFGSCWPAREAIWACPCKNLRSPDKAIKSSIEFGYSHRQKERYTHL